METGPSSKVPRLGPYSQANGQKAMNLEHLLLLLSSSRAVHKEQVRGDNEEA